MYTNDSMYFLLFSSKQTHHKKIILTDTFFIDIMWLFRLFLLPPTIGACCGADFGECSCPPRLNGDARIRGPKTTKPRYAIW